MRKSLAIRLLAFAVLWLAAAGLFHVSEARADSWLPPEKKVTLSANGQFRFTVYPASEHKVDDFFEHEKAGRSSLRPHATGRLERKRARGGWQTVWKAPLANLYAPVDALVSDDGRHVVTFDDWYGEGTGENLIVIYRADGSVVRRMELLDLVPQYYADTLTNTFSSIWWRAGAEFAANGETLHVNVIPPGGGFPDAPGSLRFSIALAGGMLTLPPAGQWDAALRKARRTALEQARAGLVREHDARNPITAPEGCDDWPWQNYLSEVFERQASVGGQRQFVWEHVLLPAADRDHNRRLNNFVVSLGSSGARDNRLAVSAPCASDVLVGAAQAAAQMVQQRGKVITGRTLWIASPKADFDTVAQILTPTGITTIWIDPDLPIPQRADRFPKNDERLRYQQDYERRLVAEIAAETPLPSDQEMP